MGEQSIKVLKEKFADGRTPNGLDFSDVFDSYLHKSTKIDQTQVLGLGDELAKLEREKVNSTQVEAIEKELPNLATKDELQSVMAGLTPMGDAFDINDLKAKPKRNNDSYFVLDQLDESGDPYIFRYDAELDDWINTKQVVNQDVARKNDLIPLEKKTIELLTGGIDIDGELYPFALADPFSKKVSFAVDKTGKFVSFAHPLLQVDTNGYEASTDPDILMAIRDENNPIAFAIYADGTVFSLPKNGGGNSGVNPFPQFSDINYILLNGQSLGAGEHWDS